MYANVAIGIAVTVIRVVATAAGQALAGTLLVTVKLPVAEVKLTKPELGSTNNVVGATENVPAVPPTASVGNGLVPFWQ